MNETVINLVNAIKSGDATATEQAFADAMSEKLGALIDTRRQDLAASMFTQPAVEESVEFTQEEWDALSEEEQAQYEIIDEVVRVTDPLRKKLDPNFAKKDGSFQGSMERKHLAAAAKDRRKVTSGSGVSGFNSKMVKPKSDQDTGRVRATNEEIELDEASKATDAGLQTRMDKNFTKSVATRYDGTRKQEAEGKKGLVKTAKIIKSRGGDAAAAKQKASDKNDQENEMM